MECCVEERRRIKKTDVLTNGLAGELNRIDGMALFRRVEER